MRSSDTVGGKQRGATQEFRGRQQTGGLSASSLASRDWLVCSSRLRSRGIFFFFFGGGGGGCNFVSKTNTH
ncbi:hypothetical protein SORBI_3002G043201 [Sorghum bicolor]|uniref:Uncharacterized protein n=1 Tax=Sorghum bicolor TaxID=4558 RepID=A0A1W0W283_SORBI|nr:hypothetical protein SORBI_3002G043201 [Sorghum bicolor]